MSKTDLWEIIGDCIIIGCGIILIFIFVTIEIFGMFGVEANRYIRWIELFLGIPVIGIGVDRFIRDARKR